MVDTHVFDRTGADTMSRRTFYLAIGACMTWGFILTAFVSGYTATWHPNAWEFLAVGLGLPFLGLFMSQSSSALISFAGLNLVAGAFGVLLGPVLASYKVLHPGLITETVELTAGVTAVMALSGFLFPNFYSKIGGALFLGLLAAVGVSVVTLFIPSLFTVTWIHMAIAALFGLYIGFDMWRASSMPATLDNAVDVSVALYLDVLNLFLQLLASRK